MASANNPNVTIYRDPRDGVRLVRPRDAGRLIGRAERTIYNWIEKGLVRTRQPAGGQGVLVEVESLVKANETPAEGEGFDAGHGLRSGVIGG